MPFRSKSPRSHLLHRCINSKREGVVLSKPDERCNMTLGNNNTGEPTKTASMLKGQYIGSAPIPPCFVRPNNSPRRSQYTYSRTCLLLGCQHPIIRLSAGSHGILLITRKIQSLNHPEYPITGSVGYEFQTKAQNRHPDPGPIPTPVAHSGSWPPT